MGYLYEKLLTSWFCIYEFPDYESAVREKHRLERMTGREYLASKEPLK